MDYDVVDKLSVQVYLYRVYYDHEISNLFYDPTCEFISVNHVYPLVYLCT